MRWINSPQSPGAGMRTVLLAQDDGPLVQSFYDANPAYFVLLTGSPAAKHAALDDLMAVPPDDFPYKRKYFIGVIDADGQLLAVADVIEDLLAAGVWHIGLFVVATALHGSGFAQRWLTSLEQWAMDGGAHYMRLGVVQTNQRAYCFWEKSGFVQVKIRTDIELGGRLHNLRVMVKPFDSGGLAPYFRLVPRDQEQASPAQSA